MKTYRETFGERVKNARKHRGFSRDCLSLASSLRKDVIKRIEKGQLEPGLNEISKLAVALEVSVDYFIGLTGSKYAHWGVFYPQTKPVK